MASHIATESGDLDALSAESEGTQSTIGFGGAKKMRDEDKKGVSRQPEIEIIF